MAFVSFVLCNLEELQCHGVLRTNFDVELIVLDDGLRRLPHNIKKVWAIP